MFVLAFILSMLYQPQPRVVFITLDGVRYQEVFQGTDRHRGAYIPPEKLVPNLYNYFVGHGVVIGRDSPMIATGPNFVSLPGYLEMTRGHASYDCVSNDCNPIIDQSIVQLFDKPAVFSSWVGIRKTLPTNYWGYSDIGAPYYRWDRDTENEVRLYLCDYSPDFLWVSLGDTDELAHRRNYAGYIEALKNADAFIGELISNDDGMTTYIITTDHGRNANFMDHDRNKQGQRVWAMMYGRGVPALGFVKTNGASLSDIYNSAWGFRYGIRLSDSLLGKIVQ